MRTKPVFAVALVVITGASLSSDNPSWRDAFVRLQHCGRIVFSAAIDGSVYARHGTSVETRLTVNAVGAVGAPTAARNPRHRSQRPSGWS